MLQLYLVKASKTVRGKDGREWRKVTAISRSIDERRVFLCEKAVIFDEVVKVILLEILVLE